MTSNKPTQNRNPREKAFAFPRPERSEDDLHVLSYSEATEVILRECILQYDLEGALRLLNSAQEDSEKGFEGNICPQAYKGCEGAKDGDMFWHFCSSGIWDGCSYQKFGGGPIN